MPDTKPETELEEIEVVVERGLSGWERSLYNCTTGDNQLRTSEWYDLIRTLHDYARDLAAALAAKEAAERERDEARCRNADLAVACNPGSAATYIKQLESGLATTRERAEAAERELAALRADAERYRWLRNCDGRLMVGDPTQTMTRWYLGTEADAIIDALRAEPGAQGG